MKHFILLVALFSIHHFFAQNLNMTNQWYFGGAQNDALGVYPSPLNDGYFLIGSSNSDISNDKTENSRGGTDLWIVKTDFNFNILWDKTIGGALDDRLWDVYFENNRIYVSIYTESGISGEKTSPNFGSFDIWVLCLDLSANIIWQNSYGGTDGDLTAKIVDYKPNSFLLVSQSHSPISGNKTVGTKGFEDIWLLEVSKTDGQILNQKDIGSAFTDELPRAIKSSQNDKIYLMCTTTTNSAVGAISGDKTDPGYGYQDLWVIVLDENLNILQDKCFGGSGTDLFPSMVEINNSLFVCANSNSSPSGNKTSPKYSLVGSDGWLIKMDTSLNIEWDKSYGGSADDGLGNVFQNINGNLILSMHSQSLPSGNKTSPRYGSGYDTWIIITDYSGNIITQATYGGTEDDFGSVIPFLNSDQELLLMANSFSGISGNKSVSTYGNSDAWLAKIDASNFLNTEKIIQTESTISVYPNPFKDQLNFDFINLPEDAILTIFSVDGKKVLEDKIIKGSSTYTWTSRNESLIYFYRLQGNSFHHNGKLMKK